MYIHICIYTHICIGMYMHIYICIILFTYTHMYNTYIYIHIYIYIFTVYAHIIPWHPSFYPMIASSHIYTACRPCPSCARLLCDKVQLGPQNAPGFGRKHSTMISGIWCSLFSDTISPGNPPSAMIKVPNNGICAT